MADLFPFPLIGTHGYTKQRQNKDLTGKFAAGVMGSTGQILMKIYTLRDC